MASIVKGGAHSRSVVRSFVAIAGCAAAFASHAADWSDTSLSVRYGTKFAEPYDNDAAGSRVDIKKTIIGLTHADGYKYGSNFFNVDVLLSDRKDPGDGVAGKPGAQEVYLVYRHTLDISKVSGRDLKYGFMRGLGATAGFDLNTKNDGYGSKKRMLVIGPTLMLEAPGFVNVSALWLVESNAPTGLADRFHYKNHGALEVDFGIGIGSLPLAFKGYALYIGSKGKNEFGGPTRPETHLDVALTYDVGSVMGMAKNGLSIGLEYEYWKNKFGNPAVTPGAGPGATAHTPMVRAEYHF